MASMGSVIGSRTSYSTSMSSAAARAVRRSPAATAARMSPTYRVVSPSPMNCGQSGRMSPCAFCPGTSTAVTTATTPGTADAADVSIRNTRARGWSENRTAPCSMPGNAMSLM